MYPLIAAITATLSWAGAGYKLWEVRRTRGSDPATTFLIVALLAMATALTMQPPAVNHVIDQMIGVAETAQVTGQIMVLTSMFGFQAMLVSVTGPPEVADRRIRRLTGVLVAVVAGLLALFALSPARQPAVLHTLLTAARYGAIYLALYAGFMAYASAGILRLAHRFAQVTDRDLVRVGLRMVTAGAATGLAYITLKVLLTVARTLAVPTLVSVEYAVIQPLIVIGPLLLVVGATLPSWGSWIGLDRPVAWLGHHRSHRILYPLWRAVYQAAQPATLHPVSTAAWHNWLMVDQVRAKLYRRYVEISDALLLLRLYRDPAVASRAEQLGRAHGLHGQRLGATVEAAQIMTAIDTKHHLDATGHTPPVEAEADSSDDAAPELPPVGSTALREEIAFLRLVSAALDSPVVRTVRDHARQQHTHPHRSAGA